MAARSYFSRCLNLALAVVVDPDYVAAKLPVAVAEVPVEPAEPMVLGMVAGIDLVLEVDSNLNYKH